MRKIFGLVVGVVLLTGMLGAQDQKAPVHKKHSDEIAFTTDVRVGTQVLKAGEYAVTGDATHFTFSEIVTRGDGARYNRKVLDLPTKGQFLGQKKENMELSIKKDKDGMSYLESLVMAGDNFQYTFIDF